MHGDLQLHTSPDGNALFLHQDIREGRKQSGGVGGHLKLGTPLTIQMPGSDALTFEDLDDVIANFAEPYLENVRALVSATCAALSQGPTMKSIHVTADTAMSSSCSRDTSMCAAS